MGNPYIKDIFITANGRTSSFTFKIIKRYGEYVIYPIAYPGKHIYNSTSHAAHLLTDNNGNPYVCWDSEITTFQDANAIMFVWAKQYARMYFGSAEGRRRPKLPSGVFRFYAKEKNHER